MSNRVKSRLSASQAGRKVQKMVGANKRSIKREVLLLLELIYGMGGGQWPPWIPFVPPALDLNRYLVKNSAKGRAVKNQQSGKVNKS